MQGKSVQQISIVAFKNILKFAKEESTVKVLYIWFIKQGMVHL